MILDYENMFSKDQAVTATASSTNTVDLGPGDAGPSERISVFVNSEPAFTGAGTLVVNLFTADAVDSSGTLISSVNIASYNISNDALLAGGQLVASRLPHGCKRYLRLTYTVTGTLAAGKLTAGLIWDVQAEEPVPSGPSGI